MNGDVGGTGLGRGAASPAAGPPTVCEGEEALAADTRVNAIMNPIIANASDVAPRDHETSPWKCTNSETLTPPAATAVTAASPAGVSRGPGAGRI